MIKELYVEFFKKNIKTYILYLIALFHIPLSKLGLPHIYGILISKIKQNDLDITLPSTLLIIIWFMVQAMVTMSNYFRSDLLPKFMSFVRNKIIVQVVDRYKNNYQDLELGNTITKIIKSPWLLEDIFFVTEDFVFRNVIIIVTSFVYLFVYNKPLGIMYIICVSLIFSVCFLYANSCSGYSYIAEKIYDKTHEEIEDTLSNLMSVYTSQKINFEKNRIRKMGKDIDYTEKEYQTCNNKFRLLFTLLFIVIFIVLNLYTLYIYKKKYIKLDILVSIIIINYTLLSSFMTLYYDTRSFVSIKGRAKIFNEYISNLPEISNDNKLKIENLKDVKIEIKDLSFYYVENKYILNNINLNFKTNDIVALVGKIGSGKTTLSKLLIRLHEYNMGHIYLNGYEINKLNLQNLRSIINYIPQHPKLFNRTLFNNITYGVNREITKEEIFKILDTLNVPDTVNFFKKNMHNKVGKNGSNLSGGQRQIVWLLRAIIKDSKVIILDEPTASLDPNSKIQIIKFIKQYSKDKIIILITHDDELLKYVNRIIKLKNGKVLSDKKNL